MKTSFKFVSLAALTAATLALPAAAQDHKDTVKCQPKAAMTKCAAKCGAKCGAKMDMKSTKCAAKKEMKVAKCGAKCAPKCGAKCAPKH